MAEAKGEDVMLNFPGPHWVTDADAELPLKVGKAGTPEGEAPTTVFNLFKETVREGSLRKKTSPPTIPPNLRRNSHESRESSES